METDPVVSEKNLFKKLNTQLDWRTKSDDYIVHQDWDFGPGELKLL